jgi:uncharacterized membrane protein YjjB (DUF3815 family)
MDTKPDPVILVILMSVMGVGLQLVLHRVFHMDITASIIVATMVAGGLAVSLARRIQT